ncbi:unnamed protein product, partial [marine sediment metagenome]
MPEMSGIDGSVTLTTTGSTGAITVSSWSVSYAGDA